MRENHQPLKAKYSFCLRFKKPVGIPEVKMLCDIVIKGEAVFRLQEVEKC